MISAAELRARVVVEGVPKGNKELGVFEGTLKRVSGYDATATLHADVDHSGFTAFEGEVRDASGRSATATLEADLQGRGFDEFAARIDAANLRTARPITQTVKAEVDQRSFTSTLAEIRALKSKVDRESGGGGLTHSAAGIVAPFGALPAAAALASPELIALAGAATAVAGSAGEAALGVGAMLGGAYGAGAVGIGGIVAVAAPAVASLKELTKAQDAYSVAVATYGKESTEAETAAKKLRIAEKEAGPEAEAVARSLSHVKSEWEKLSRPGRNEFLGAIDDSLGHLEGRLPMLAKSANRSTTAMRHDLDLFLDETTGKGSGFDHFIGSMTDLFVHEGPMVTHTLGDWLKVLEHIAEAAGPSLERETKTFEHWSDSIEKSSEHAPALRKDIEGFVDQTESWVHFLAQGSDLIFAIFGAGAGEGQSLVEDATTKVEDWRHSIEADPTGTESFFAETGEEAKELTTILAGLIGTWYQEAKALEPVADTALHIVDALNSLKIGNVSALTVLLGGGYAIGSAAKLARTLEILKGYGAVTGLLRAEQTEQEAVATAQGAGVGSADALTAANERLAGSIEAVTTAQAEQAAAQGGAQLSMLESGAVGEAEQAGQMSMFPMGGGVVPEAVPAAATVEETAAGTAGAGMFASGMGLALPAAIGGIGIANIVTSATSGDMKDAGWEAGGSLAGGIAGFFVGGPAGAMIGAGVGSVLGEVVSHGLADVFDGHKSAHHLEQVGEEQARHFLHGYTKERPKIEREIKAGYLGHAGQEPHVVAGGAPNEYIPGFGTVQGAHSLVGGSKGTGLRGRRQELQEQIHDDATPKATKAFEAEIRAIDKAIGGIKKARSTFAETIGQMQGDVALGMGAINSDLTHGLGQADAAWGEGTKPWRKHTAEAMEGAVAAIRTGIDDGTINAEKGQKRINQLLSEIHLVKGDDPWGLAKATASSFEKAGGITASGVRKWEHQLDQMPPAAAHSAVDSTNKLLQGWAEGHPKIEAQIRSLTAFEVQHFGATNKQLREGVQKGATGPVAEAFQEAALGVGGALDNIGVNTNRLLKAVGAKDFVNFQAIVLGPSRMAGTQLNSEGGGSHAAGEAKHHQLATGGIVPGTASGDVHFTHVRPNTFILNKKATAAYGFAEGGHIPVALEPGERRFEPEEVARIGLGNLMAMNDSVPRYAEGGHVDVSGPRSTGSAAHGALAIAAKATNAYIKAHTPKPTAGGLYSGPTPAGVGTFQGYPVDKWIIPELEYAVAHGWKGHITSGYRTPAHSAELGFPGDEHTKTSYPGGAVDFGGMHEAAASANRAAFIAATKGYKGPKLHLPIGFEDDGHMSGTGHRLGGLVRGYAAGGLVGDGRLKLAGGGFTGSGYTVKGAKPTAEQMRVATEIGNANSATGAPYEAQVAIFMAATQENDMTGNNTFEVTSASGAGNRNDSTYDQAVRWQTDGYYDGPILGAGGGIEKSHKSNDPGLVAQEVEGSAHPTLYEQWKPEGQKWASGWSGTAGGKHETKAEEVAGTFNETVPQMWGGVHAGGSLSISTSLPGSMRGINAEIHRRSHELEQYTTAAAAAEKADKPAIAHAISKNIAALQKRLRELHQGKAALRKKEEGERRAKRIKVAERHVAARLKGGLDRLTGLTPGIEGAEGHYNKLSETAQHTVDLEPVAPEAGPEPALPERPTFAKGTPKNVREAGIKVWEQQTRDSTRDREVATHQAEVEHAERLRAYIEGEEAPAYAAVLGAAASWRNRILGAEHKAAGDWANTKTVGGLEGGWEYDVESIVSQEKAIEGRERAIETFAAEVEAEVAKYRKANPGDPLTSNLKDREEKRRERVQGLAGLRAEVRGLEASERATRTTLGEGRELFYPGGARINDPRPPRPGTGTFEGYLEDVQGIHWPDLHEYMQGLPSTRGKTSFGGAIYDTQGTIEELGLQAAAAMNSVAPLGPAEGPEEEEEFTGGPTQAEQEHLAFVEEQNRHLNEEKVARRIEEGTLGPGLPYAGGYASGGTVAALVGENGPEIAAFRPGTHITSAPETRSLLSPSVVIHHYEAEGRYEVEVDGQQVKADIRRDQRRAARRAGRGLARAGS